MSWKAVFLTACLLTCLSSATSTTSADFRDRQDRDRPARPASALSYSNCTTSRVSWSPQHHHDPSAATVKHTPQHTALYSRETSPVTRLIPRPTGSENNYNAATVNAVNATLKFWWTTTNYVAVSTVSIQFDTNDVSTGWTVYEATETFNTASAITTSTCLPPYATGTYQGTPYTLSYCNKLPTHVAATTSALYIEAFKSPSVTTASMMPLPDLQITPPPAQIVLAAQTFRTGTPFVQFSEYEVVRCVEQRNSSCRATTQRHTLSAPYAFGYRGPNPALATNVDAKVTGQLDRNFPIYINRTSLVPGSWSAPPTVIIVVDRILVAIAVLAAHVEATADTLDVPTAMLPPGYSPLPQRTTTTQHAGDINPTARIEVTQSWLLVPGAATSAPAALQATEAQQETPSAATCVAGCPVPVHPIVAAGATFVPERVVVYVADGKTALKGGAAITLGAQTVSAFASGDSLLVYDGTVTKTIAAKPSGVITVNGVQITATSMMMYTGSGRTVMPGGSVVTIDGTALSMPTSGGLQIGSQATSSTSAGGIAPHIIDGLGETTTTSNGGLTSQPAIPMGNSASRSAVDHAWWLVTVAVLGLAWRVV
ncbi:hypothetical protein AMS68_007077 [Peltaster fructicola]|uniref:VWFD domain-containing protein n=1 Tax=Peltaster fructicola TaxID=286661 RepID=A0A6H0Y4M6_9PEZI|nr:hypothetical protein AMS68_007077 [Peltaster fructicola]